MDEHVATIWFIDGLWRPVYAGDDGRRYLIDGDGRGFAGNAQRRFA
jgi:hypothetical protein